MLLKDKNMWEYRAAGRMSVKQCPLNIRSAQDVTAVPELLPGRARCCSEGRLRQALHFGVACFSHTDSKHLPQLKARCKQGAAHATHCKTQQSISSGASNKHLHGAFCKFPWQLHVFPQVAHFTMTASKNGVSVNDSFGASLLCSKVRPCPHTP